MTELPERINVMKVISYDVPHIVECIVELNAGEITAEDVTLDEIIELVNTWALEDMESAPTKSLIFQDENGQEL